MSTATKTKKLLTENQKKVLRVLAGGAPRTKDDFLAAGVTQYIKGIRALVAREMVWSNDDTHYRITGPGMTALREADGATVPVDTEAETQVIELAPVTHPLLDFTESPVGLASMYGKKLDGSAFVALNAPAEKGVSELLVADDYAPDTEPAKEKVSVWESWEQTPEGGRKWVAEVSKDESDGAVLYTSPPCPTADGAKYDALAWAEANKYEVV